MATVTIERRKRGIIGWFVTILFCAWNLMMLAITVTGLNATAQQYHQAANEFARQGTEIGTTIGMGLVLILWALGSFILGMMMLFTRGKRILITRET